MKGRPAADRQAAGKRCWGQWAARCGLPKGTRPTAPMRCCSPLLAAGAACSRLACRGRCAAGGGSAPQAAGRRQQLGARARILRSPAAPNGPPAAACVARGPNATRLSKLSAARGVRFLLRALPGRPARSQSIRKPGRGRSWPCRGWPWPRCQCTDNGEQRRCPQRPGCHRCA